MENFWNKSIVNILFVGDCATDLGYLLSFESRELLLLLIIIISVCRYSSKLSAVRNNDKHVEEVTSFCGLALNSTGDFLGQFSIAFPLNITNMQRHTLAQ